MNLTLYKKEWKSNWILLTIFAAVLTVYATMIVAMFDPKMGDSLKVMADSMPEIFAAFGMADVGQTLLEFISGYLYGILFTAFPAVYIILLSNKLVARYIDNGSMAYLLAVPEKRTKMIRTQVIYSITSMLALLIYIVAVLLLCSQMMFSGELEIAGFFRLNVGLFGLWMMMGGVCFFFSSVFNDSKWASGCSTAFVVYAILVQMISQVGDKFEHVKYATPMTLFQVDGLVAGESSAWVTCVIMYLIGVVFFVAAVQVFARKDLPL